MSAVPDLEAGSILLLMEMNPLRDSSSLDLVSRFEIYCSGDLVLGSSV
jgi:hypothetical protein